MSSRRGAAAGSVRRLRSVLLASVGSVGCVAAAGGAHAQATQPVVSLCSGTSVTLPALAGGATIGVNALDPNGNIVTLAPGASCSVAVNSPNGITVGGGRTDGLGGTGALATTGDSTAIAIGNGANAGTVNAAALGSNASATANGAVALGSNSVANRLNAGAELFSGSGLRTTLGVASVGSVGNERQITNVAGGTLDTDAANIRQLRSVGTSLANAVGGGAGFNATTGVFTNPTFTIRGTNYTNVGTALTAADTALGLNASALANLQLGLNTGTIGLVQQDPTTRTITVGANTNGTLLNVAGTAGARRVTGVAAGTGPTDAVDVTQLNSALASMGAGSAALSSENSGGAAPALATGLRSVAVGYGSVATAADTLSVGAPGTERRIVNVAAGTLAANSTDAVTGGQLFATNNAVAANTSGLGTLYGQLAASLGGGAAYNAGTGAYTFPTYTIRGNTYNSVGTAFAAVDNALANIGGGGGGGAGGNAAPFVGNDPGGTTPPVAGGVKSIAGGYQAAAMGAAGSAVGDTAKAMGDYSTSIGGQSVAGGTGSSAIGARASAMDFETTAVGGLATAMFQGSLALGSHAQALADPTTAIGYYASATGDNAVALGAYSTASADSATAIGTNSAATAANATALGRNASAAGVNALALGQAASAGGTGAVAIGQGAQANQDNAIAIGTGVATWRSNQVAIGGGGSSYTLAGLGSGASNAAQSGSTKFVTTDTAGNLGTSNYGPDSIGTMANQVTQLDNSVNQLTHLAVAARREARSGIASAMAMAAAPMPSAAGKTSWAANGSSFKGEWASGLSVAHRLDVAVPLAVTAGYSYGEAAGHGVRFGLAGEF